MTLLIRQLLIATAGMVVVFLLSGCNLAPVGIHYTPQPNVVAVSGADKATVHVEVLDLRFNNLLGQRENSDSLGTNNVTGEVRTTNDVVSVLREAVKTELAHRGFRLSDSGVQLVLSLEKFESSLNRISSVRHYVFEHLDFRNTASAEITLSAEIRKFDGTTLYSKTFTGYAEKPDAELDAPTAEFVLNDALKNCLARLFADPSLTEHLLKPTGNADANGQSAMVH